MEKKKKKEDVFKHLDKIVEEVHRDDKTIQLSKEYQRKHGTITSEDLRRVFTI